jgi:hypothetical protein
MAMDSGLHGKGMMSPSPKAFPPQYFPANIGKHHPVTTDIEIFVSPCILNGLEGDAANTLPFQRVFDNVA